MYICCFCPSRCSFDSRVIDTLRLPTARRIVSSDHLPLDDATRNRFLYRGLTTRGHGRLLVRLPDSERRPSGVPDAPPEPGVSIVGALPPITTTTTVGWLAHHVLRRGFPAVASTTYDVWRCRDRNDNGDGSSYDDTRSTTRLRRLRQ